METPNGLAWTSRRGPRAGHVRIGVSLELGRGCRLHRGFGLEGESEPEITGSARGAGGTEEKKISANGGTGRREQTEVCAEGR
jgi:hypothetical protein